LLLIGGGIIAKTFWNLNW